MQAAMEGANQPDGTSADSGYTCVYTNLQFADTPLPSEDAHEAVSMDPSLSFIQETSCSEQVRHESPADTAAYGIFTPCTMTSACLFTWWQNYAVRSLSLCNYKA